jgi:alpha,alpha-trehalase
MQLIAVQGLRRYGYAEEADRITVNFLSMILKEFITHKTVVEKYDVARRTLQVALEFGYAENVADFGWTAAVFTELYASLPEGKQREVLRLDGVTRTPRAGQAPSGHKALSH